jgi:ABC-type Zn2+ transport system substrate-binding protein/surface adhesin
MKKTIGFLFIIVTLIASCKNTDHKTEITTSIAPTTAQIDTLLQTAWINDLRLNNGIKWEANRETTEGVLKMQTLLQSETTHTIEEYVHLASKLNVVKNEVVKECTMKGASHDNLHLWLYPLIKKIKALSEVNSLEEASKLKQSIEENLKVYATYFQ